MSQRIVLANVFVLLWGAFLLELMVPLALALLMSGASILWRVATSARMDTIGWLLGANVLYWLASGFAVGALAVVDFLKPSFYTGDGRILISLMPLVLFCLVDATRDTLERTARMVTQVALLSLLLFLVWALTRTSLLSGPGHADEFHGFLTSHTGAGTFFGSVGVFVSIYGLRSRRLWVAILGLALLGPVLGSGSREALTGVIAVAGWYIFACNPAVRNLLLVGLVIVVTVTAMPFISTKTYNRTAELFSPQLGTSVVEQAGHAYRSDWRVGDWTPATSHSSDLEEGDTTALVRIMLWTYAAKRVANSPLLGMGWGRFNDRDIVDVDVPYLGLLALSGERVFSTSHAHNSYLQLLAESGVPGFFLYLSVWAALYLRFTRAARLTAGLTDFFPYFDACRALVLYALVCALTGHALAAPSMMIPVATILGVGIAFTRRGLIPLSAPPAERAPPPSKGAPRNHVSVP